MTRLSRRERLIADREEYARIIAEQTGTTTPKAAGQVSYAAIEEQERRLGEQAPGEGS